jgi:hypothetical protein
MYGDIDYKPHVSRRVRDFYSMPKIPLNEREATMSTNAISRFFLVLTFFIVILACSEAAIGGEAPRVSTDKESYSILEAIKVSFFNAPGRDDDWICIVPAGSPDTEAGDYQYMPRGLGQGFIMFGPRSAGKYEVRAYYNYSSKGYVVSARYPFSVGSSPEAEAVIAQTMERKIDPNNPLEANLPPGNGLVYIFREALYVSSTYEVQVITNGKPVVVMRDSSYYPYSVPAGVVQFTTGGVYNIIEKKIEEGVNFRVGETKITVKPGFVYYLRLKVLPMFLSWNMYLDHMPHQEGANLIKSYELNLLK